MSGLPDDDRARERRRAMQAEQLPDNEIPVSVAVDLVLAEVDDLAAFVSGVRVYSTGVEFTVVAVSSRRAAVDEDGFARGLLIGRRRDGLLPGVEFADGRVGSAQSGRPPLPGRGGDVNLRSSGGGGGPRHATSTYFTTPLPPPGPLRFVAVWPGAGVEETVVEIDATPWADAALRVRRLWEPVDDEPARPTSPAPVPRGGWFEANEARLRGE